MCRLLKCRTETGGHAPIPNWGPIFRPWMIFWAALIGSTVG